MEEGARDVFTEQFIAGSEEDYLGGGEEPVVKTKKVMAKAQPPPDKGNRALQEKY